MIISGYLQSKTPYYIGGDLLCGLRVSEIIKQTALKAKIYNPITPYTRRNSFTTHLIHNGTDIKYRQIILGHSDIKIAQI
ncbi:MAG: tyrosine-type recombinase/integrase [Flammeovirgaceae bacterium]|nr:tyrosine-type recombinase/integrase [Flammeovirgaceae bacterium]